MDRLASQRPPGCRGEVLSVSDGGLARGAFSDQAGDEFPTNVVPNSQPRGGISRDLYMAGVIHLDLCEVVLAAPANAIAAGMAFLISS